MRLIDADKIQEHLEKVKKESASLVDLSHIIGFQSVVDAQPTAFDVDKIVEQLEKESYYIDIETDREVVNLNEAIEIIRGGGV